MVREKDKPRRLMTKVRRRIGKPTMVLLPKSIYDRSRFKRETEKIIEEEE